MNVGKLNTALSIIKSDADDYKIVSRMNEVKTTLNQSIKEPNPNNTNNFKVKYAELTKILEECESNLVTPTDYKLFDEIGATTKIGLGLLERIHQLFQDFNITPEKALSEFSGLVNEVQEFNNSVNIICEEFENLNLESAGLEENKPVIGVSFPLSSKNYNLKNLENITHEVDMVLKTFSEVVGEGTAELEIKYISSSDLGIFLITSLPLALCFVKTLNQIADLYKKHLEIKKLKLDLEKKKLPKNVTAPIDHYINQTVTIELNQIGEKLVDEFYKEQDSGRKNELKIAMSKRIQYLAKEIDKGVIFEAEVSIEEEPEEPEDEQQKQEYKTKLKQFKEREKKVREINEKGRSIQNLINGNEPILFIPEKVDKKKPE